MLPSLNMSVQAVQKRNYRVIQREKRRRSFFIHDYIRTKYPQLFTEANAMYQQFVDKYPGKADFTKSYYFKKWQREMDKTNNPLMIPHLPILMSSDILQQTTTKHPPKVQQQPPEVQQQSPEVQQQAPEVQQRPPEVQQRSPEVQQQSPEVQQQSPEVQQQSPEVQQQAPEVQQRPPEVQQQSPEVQQQAPEVQQRPPKVQQTVEVQTTESDQLTTGMSLDEMSLAVEQIVNALQSDRELMDIVEELDLPDAVWDNELAIPDYLLETELHW